MLSCIQCGAALTAELARCPTCARPVGDSSVGRARERQANPGVRRAVIVLASIAALTVVASMAFGWFRASPRLSTSRQAELAIVAAPSLVKVEGPASAGGVVLRSLGDALLVATHASAAPSGREVRVLRGDKSARGFGLLVGEGRVAEEFALVLVPQRARLEASEARLGDKPNLDAPILALGADGKAVGAGAILSFEDGPGAGIVVHDAPIDRAERGYGLWNSHGRLAALPAMARAGGDHLAIAAATVFERLLLHRVELPAGVEWSEQPVPVAAGTRVAVVLAGPADVPFSARVGDKGAIARSRQVWPGLQAVELTAVAGGMVQIGRAPSQAAAQATVVTLGRL